MTTSVASKTSLTKYLVVLLVAATLLVLFYVLRVLDREPRTDDAYVYADTIDVVPEVSGLVTELAVSENQMVHRGDLLFRIDPRPYEATLQRARATLVALDRQIALMQRTVDAQQYNAQSAHAVVERARAAAAQATDTLRRTAPLLPQGYVSAQDVDLARTAQRTTRAELAAAELQARQAQAAVSGVEALVAQRAIAEADIAIAELNLEFATVRAPFDGRVVSLKTSAGQFASTLKPVFTLIDTRQWYVVANFRETELKDIRVGTPATVYLLSDTDRRFQGSVDSISYGVLPDEGGIALPGGLPRIERTLNWVHVAQRFPVRIKVGRPDPALFRLGTSAVAVLYARRRNDTASREARQ